MGSYQTPETIRNLEHTRNHDLQTPPPDVRRIPEDDILGATVVMVTCSYKSNEFVRVGYWVANTYTETLPEGAHAHIDVVHFCFVIHLVDEI